MSKTADPNKSKISRILIAVTFSGFVGLLMFHAVSGMNWVGNFLPLPAGLLAFLFSMSNLSVWTRPSEPTRQKCDETLFASVVIAVYNEQPELFERALTSLAVQSRLPDRVWIIDDGSDNTACLEIAHKWLNAQPPSIRSRMDVRVLEQKVNQGKRHAIARAFRQDAECDIFFTMDSDTLLDQRAIELGLCEFSDPTVFGMAGTLFGHNRDTNWLTRVIDIEFAGSFLVSRAAMSRMGSVLVTCGSLAAYRAEVCRSHVDEMVTEKFAGRPVLNGDDRLMTMFALQQGKVVLSEQSIGFAALPESIGHYFRQRTRWSTSFYRGTLKVLRGGRVKGAPFWLTAGFAGMFLAQTTAIIILVLWGQTLGWLNLLLAFVAWSLPEIFVRHQRYWHSSVGRLRKADFFDYLLLSPAATLLGLFVNLPARYFAILHLANPTWHTRNTVEDVTLKDPAPDHEPQQPQPLTDNKE